METDQPESNRPGEESGDIVGERKSRRAWALLAGAVVIVVILVAGSLVFLADSAGASTPEQAITKLIDAVNEDAFEQASLLLNPGERRGTLEFTAAIQQRLVELGLLDEQDFAETNPVELRFEGVKVTSEKLSENLARVRFVSGRLKFDVDTSVGQGLIGEEIPLDSLGGSITIERLNKMIDTFNEENDANLSGPFVIAIRFDGRWYLSLFYTIAELIREALDGPLPNYGVFERATGEPTPSRAIEDFLRAIAGVDLKEIIAMVAPDEFAVLHDYSVQIIGSEEVQNFYRDASGAFSARILALKMKEERLSDGVVKVSVTSARFNLTEDGETTEISIEGTCATVEEERSCLSEVLDEPGLGFVDPAALSLVAVEVEGRWYFSPLQTIYQFALELLDRITKEDVDKFKEGFPFADEFGSGFEVSESTPLQLDGAEIPEFTFDPPDPVFSP